MTATPAARRRPRAHQWFAMAGILVVAAYGISTALRLPLLVNELLYNAAAAAGAVAVFAGIWLHRPAARTAWLLLGAGAAVSALADVAFYQYPPLAGAHPVDVLYLSRFPLMVLALALFVRRRTPAWDAPAAIDAGIVTVSVALAGWVFVFAPANDAAPGLLRSAVSIAYPAGDLVLLAIGAWLLLGAGAPTVSLRLLGGYLLLLLGSDAVYPATAVAGYRPGGWLDLFWIVNSVLLGAAALHPSMVWVAERSPAIGLHASDGRLALLALATLLAPLVLVVQYLRGGDQHPLLVAAGCAALYLLVLGRLYGMVRAQRYASVTDSLTGLRTRRFFEQVLGAESARAGREHKPLSLVLMDVDHFKRVNDTYGHAAGDRVLCEVARRLRSSVRAGDLVARYGGEEFAILLPRTDPAIAYGVAERLRAAIGSRTIAITETTAIPVTVSAGLVAIPRHAATAAELVLTADRLLYDGKAHGRNRVSTPGAPQVSTR